MQEQWDEIDEAIRNSPVWEKGTRVDEVELPSSDPAMPEHGGDEVAAATAATPQYWQSVLEADEGAESVAGVPTEDDRSTRKPDLPDELRDLILTMARRPDVHSVSCPTRVGPIAGSWWLYSSNGPYKDCHRMPRSKPWWRPKTAP